MRTTIYWFSGTGNSLFAAKLLAEQLGDADLASMAGAAPLGAVGGGIPLFPTGFPPASLALRRARAIAGIAELIYDRKDRARSALFTG